MIWIDIEDSNGVKQGAGPLATATNWRQTALLDRAGTFAFELPASDPGAALLRIKRIARCWTADATGLHHLGAGIINDVALDVTPDGAAMLQVTGDDLLHELTYRNVGELALVDDTWFHPCEFFLIGSAELASETKGGAGFINLDLAIDYEPFDATTYIEASAYGLCVVIKATRQFDTVRCKFSTHSTTTASLNALYYDGISGQYEMLGVTDGTSLAGATCGQDGDITFSPPSTWGIAPDDTGYKIAFQNSPAGFEPKLYDLSCHARLPTENALAPILTCAPPGWSLDSAQGYDSITGYQEYGDNLLFNSSFEEGIPGTLFTGWSISGTDANDTVEATATAAAGSRAVKITNTDLYAKPRLAQEVALDAESQYLFTLQSRGDGTRDGYYTITSDGDPIYGHRIVSYNWTGNRSVAYAPHQILFAVPTGITTAHVELRGPDYLYAGSVYWDDLTLRKLAAGDVFIEFANESVLEALIRVAETTGEHFILSPAGRQVLWLRADQRKTGVRCVSHSAAPRGATQADIALITSLTEQQSAYDLVSRVYPFGGGSGAERITLANTNRPAPDGYALDKVNNCLIRTAAETAYGRIDKRLDVPDVVQLNNAAAGLTYAANMLFDRAYVYLSRHSATDTDVSSGDVPRAYTLTLAKCAHILLPGHTVRVQYDEWQDATRTIHIDRDMWILGSTIQAGANGILTTALQCATIDAVPLTDAALLADLLRKQRAMAAHAPGG